MTFTAFGLNNALLQSIEEQGYKTPSPIQQEAIPAVMEGRDVMAAAQTGTGKTAAFMLPILHKLSLGGKTSANKTRVLILTPTRELADQINSNAKSFAQHLKLSSTVVYGGVNINPQMLRLRKGVDILVATPGRLLDLVGRNAVSFSELEILVLDEADRMLDMGFIHDIRKILNLLPKKRQNLMFSATFADKVRQLAKTFTANPVEITISPKVTTASSVEQWIYTVDKKQKSALLSHLIKEENWFQVLVFVRTKHGANRLAKNLSNKDITSSAIHGNKSQSARMLALEEFKQGKVQVLVATDIAARGLDIDKLPLVVNFDLPHVAEDYVHRIGRTGRAASAGQAFSLVCADEFKELTAIERLIKKVLTRELVEGFVPAHKVPPSNLDLRPIKPKKPKKPRKPKANMPRHEKSKPRSKSKPRRRPSIES